MWRSDDVLIWVLFCSVMIVSFCAHWQRGRIMRLESKVDDLEMDRDRLKCENTELRALLKQDVVSGDCVPSFVGPEGRLYTKEAR